MRFNVTYSDSELKISYFGQIYSKKFNLMQIQQVMIHFSKLVKHITLAFRRFSDAIDKQSQI